MSSDTRRSAGLAGRTDRPGPERRRPRTASDAAAAATERGPSDAPISPRPTAQVAEPVPRADAVTNGWRDTASSTARQPPSIPGPGLLGRPNRPGEESIDGRFLRIARWHSLCDDDACEALARGLEIAVRHGRRVRPETAAMWFAAVVRHEAIRVRQGRRREVSLDAVGHHPHAEEPDSAPEPDPRLPALRAAMRQLKPDQRRALLLFYAMDGGHGHRGRYRRIMQATGWSYTKVNRCLTEGRAALRALLVGESLAPPPDGTPEPRPQ